jgi:uncharacterized damage-inducible protein DinB
MMSSSVHTMIDRELAALRRSVEAYRADADLWATPPGIANSGGNLVLHLAGNLQYFFGAVLAKTGYQRDRPAEFSRRDVSRDELLSEIDAASAAVAQGLNRLTDASLREPFPEQVGGRTVTNGDWIVHLAAHLAYHLGQVDYHRRIVSGDGRTVDAVSVRELPAVGA